MEALRKKAKELLESGAVKVVIGYGVGTTPDRTRPLFAGTAKDAEQLIVTDRCVQNLATYLLKPEVKALGKPAIVAQKPALRTILQYAAENQIADDSFIALTVTDKGELKELPKLAAIEEYVATLPRGISAKDREEIAKISAMPREERWQFWQAEMSRCLKCYACRAACPLCYCTKCITENKPAAVGPGGVGFVW